jgi:anti-sigma factor RsiW
VHAASDQLTGLLSDAERSDLEDHLGGCDSCSTLMDQLRTTVAVLGSRPEVQVPDSLRARWHDFSPCVHADVPAVPRHDMVLD